MPLKTLLGTSLLLQIDKQPQSYLRVFCSITAGSSKLTTVATARCHPQTVIVQSCPHHAARDSLRPPSSALPKSGGVQGGVGRARRLPHAKLPSK